MGSYSAPSYQAVFDKVIVDNTDALDSIVFEKENGFWAFNAIISTLYDGAIAYELKDEDGVWQIGDTVPQGANKTSQVIFAGPTKHGYVGLDISMKTSLRIRVSTEATIGNCVIQIMTLPAPSNPLF